MGDDTMTGMADFRGFRWSDQRGLSLIELLVAIAISSIVILGLVTLITSIGVANRAQDGLARLQENGRFAVQRIAADLRAASSQHCSSFDVEASVLGTGGSTYVDVPRAPRVYFDAATNPATLVGPAGFATSYLMSTRFMMVGHECDAATCTPAVNAPNRGVHRVGGALPAMGTAPTERARGSDVLTLRFLNGEGVRVIAQNGWQPGPPDASIVLQNNAPALALAGFTAMGNDPVWVSDCSASEVFLGTRAGTTVQMAGNFDNSRMQRLDLRSDVRAFHVPTALQTVTYYLQLQVDPRDPGRTMSVLMRRAGAAAAQALVEGVERFDLLYGVNDALGRTSYLTAAQVDALGGVGSQCPPYPVPILPVPAAGTNEPGCGWRAVKSVEIYLLANTVDDVSPRRDDEFRYSWLNSGAANPAGTYENPQALGTLRNGLPAGRMLRREFRTLVNLRGYNY
jgi:type IV pilus assembly protein PilW